VVPLSLTKLLAGKAVLVRRPAEVFGPFER
jgi:hypothetical protein